jgi:hypothetical protein
MNIQMTLEKAVVHELHEQIQIAAIIDAFTPWVTR